MKKQVPDLHSPTLVLRYGKICSSGACDTVKLIQSSSPSNPLLSSLIGSVLAQIPDTLDGGPDAIVGLHDVAQQDSASGISFILIWIDTSWVFLWDQEFQNLRWEVTTHTFIMFSIMCVQSWPRTSWGGILNSASLPFSICASFCSFYSPVSTPELHSLTQFLSIDVPLFLFQSMGQRSNICKLVWELATTLTQLLQLVS